RELQKLLKLAKLQEKKQTWQQSIRPLELSPNNLYNEKAEDTMIVETVITEPTNTEVIQDIKMEPTTSEMKILSSSASIDNNQPLESNQSEMKNTIGQDNIAVDPLAIAQCHQKLTLKLSE
ncbi:13255_t:CDS:1, partial [Ambispora leptoticha]